MTFFVYAALIALLLWCLPYLRIAVKRIRMVLSLRALCGKHNRTLSGTHPLWFFASNHCKNCDFHIYTGSHLYCVKLFAVKRRHSTLHLYDERNYRIVDWLGLIGMATSARIPVEGRLQKMPMYNFRYKLDPAWETADHHNILLINPVCFEIYGDKQNGKTEVLGAGDRYYDMQLYSLERLLGRITLDNEKSIFTEERF